MSGAAGWCWAALVLAGACQVPYEPLQADLEGLPPGAFARVVAVVRGRYPRLALADAETFRVRSAWVPLEDDQLAGQKRATVFLQDGARLSVVVEARYLRIGLLGEPEWSAIVGAPRLERDLLEALLVVLETPGPTRAVPA